MLKKGDIIDALIFLFCVALCVVSYIFNQKFMAIAFGMVSVVYLFYSITKIGNRYVIESRDKMKRGEL